MKSIIRAAAKHLPSSFKLALARRYLGVQALGRRIGSEIDVAHRSLSRRYRQKALGGLERSRQPIVLFMTPEAGLTPFFASHAILAKTLSESGHAGVVLSCGGILPTCTWKIARSVGRDDPDACISCRQQAAQNLHVYGLVDISIESLVGSDLRNEIESIIAANTDNPRATIYDGIKFGVAAVCEALRVLRRLDETEFTAQDRAFALALLRTSLTIYFGLREMKDRFSISRIAYMGDYGFWITAQAFAEREGIGVTRINHLYHLDVDRRRIGLQPGSAHSQLYDQIANWNRVRDRVIDPPMVANIADGSLYRLRGHGGASTYSPNWLHDAGGLRERLGLRADRKTIVAYSSSADEFVASIGIMDVLGMTFAKGPRPFEDQVDWLTSLAEWVGARDDLQLVIRLHPRMAAGPRHAAESTEYAFFRQLFSKNLPHVAVVWPSDSVSSYNLAEIADAVTVSWSTIGLELARFGVPVIAAFSGIGPFPTGSFIAFEETAGKYFAELNAAISRPAALEAISEAFRWTHYAFWAPGVDVSDVVPTHDYAGLPPWRTPARQAEIVRVLVDGEDMAAVNMARMPTGVEAEQQERDALHAAVKRFIGYLMRGTDREISSMNIRSSLADGSGWIEAEIDGETYCRHSPLVSRLARLARHWSADKSVAAAPRQFTYSPGSRS
jgi:hypothetical protein